VAECLRSVALLLHKIPVVVEFFVFARNVPEERRVMSLLWSRGSEKSYSSTATTIPLWKEKNKIK
jgi:hypothetical protein